MAGMSGMTDKMKDLDAHQNQLDALRVGSLLPRNKYYDRSGYASPLETMLGQAAFGPPVVLTCIDEYFTL